MREMHEYIIVFWQYYVPAEHRTCL